MEVLFLDTAYKTTRIVDAFTSLIWVDNYIGYGTFELRLPMDDNTLAGIRIGWYASIKESPKYMVVEGIEITTSLENGNLVKITGRSLESILDRRIVINDMTFSGNVADAITRLLNENAIDPEDTNRKITRLISKSTTDTSILNTEFEMSVNAGENLYDLIYEICDSFKIGFRVLPDVNTDGGMIFELYNGVDRSYNQEKNPWVVFSPKFENIKETDMTMDTEGYKTTVIGTTTFKWTYIPSGSDEEITEDKTISVVLNGDKTDLDRREIYNKSNISAENTVDKESFGKAKDMVNAMDYSSYEPVYFDRDSYNKDYEKYTQKLSNAYVPRKEESTKQEWVWYKPGDDKYDAQYANMINVPGLNGYWKTETVPGDTIEQFKENNKRYYSIMENEEPNKDSYMHYAWIITDREGYNRAIAAAQKKIDNAYAEAVQGELDKVEEDLNSECERKLAPYLVISEFDGEVDSNVQFTFGNSYYLGDIVQIVNEFNFQAVTRVVSMTFTEESGVGVVNYPGFASDNKAVFEL